MMHKAWKSIEEVSCCFSRPSIKFQGRVGQTITNFGLNWAFPMRKKLATVSSPWPKWSQPAVTEPWPGPWLSCDLAVTEPWSYWRCRDWAVTSPWQSCDLAVTELWPRRDWAVTSPSRDWAVIIGPRSRDNRGHRELTVTIYFLMG